MSLGSGELLGEKVVDVIGEVIDVMDTRESIISQSQLFTFQQTINNFTFIFKVWV